jgi:hypothetical protein
LNFAKNAEQIFVVFCIRELRKELVVSAPETEGKTPFRKIVVLGINGIVN